MRVFDTLVTFLVIGTFSSTIAGEQIPESRNTRINHRMVRAAERDRHPLVHASFVLGMADSGMKRLVKEVCEINGQRTEHSTSEESWWSFSNCTESVVSKVELEADMRATLSRGNWYTFFKKYCRKLPAFMQCLTNMVDSGKPCADPEGREIARSNYQNMIGSFVQFICENDGHESAAFFANGGMECLSSKQLDLRQKCPYDNPGKEFQELALKGCTDLERLGNCIVAVMGTCEDPTPANGMKSLFDFFRRWKSCPAVSAAQGSSAT